MKKIKICGLKRIEDIEAVNIYRPDYIGFVFAKSRRQVTEAMAIELRKKLAKDIEVVGVFVNESNDRIVDLLDKEVIDIAQLHGNEGEEDIIYIKNKSGKKVIKAISVQETEDIIKWKDTSADYLLLDNGAGGTGQSFDWSKITSIGKPFFIAGGINQSNINEALKLEAYGIDTSGGVETEGLKDPDKIKAIIECVREH